MAETTKTKKAATRPKITDFWTQAAAAFDKFIVHWEDTFPEYQDRREYFAALHLATWKFVEKLVKQSYRNGIEKGKRVARQADKSA